MERRKIAVQAGHEKERERGKERCNDIVMEVNQTLKSLAVSNCNNF